MFIDFLYELRRSKVPVGKTEAVVLAEALARGLHESSLDGFYHVARAILVHRESDLDPFDAAFLAHFRGIETDARRITEELLKWLEETRKAPTLTDEERALLQAFDPEELRKRFEQTMREQTERHDGGNRWIGTRGTSPFGRLGN